MKNKKALKIGFIGATLTGVAVAFALVLSNSTGLLKVRGIDHDANCQWNHYSAVAATYAQHGSKEFWACCDHHSFSLSEPGEGHITDMGAFVGDYFVNLDPADDRYIPALEGGNFFAKIDVGPSNNNGAALPEFRTANSYSNVTGYKLRYKVSGAHAEGKSGWAGFYVGSADKDVYSVYDSSCGGKAIDLHSFDGQWHELTVRFDVAKSGYFAFGHALTNFAEGTHVDVDDLVIYGDQIMSEEFSKTPSAKLIASDFVALDAEAPAVVPQYHNRFMRIALSNSIDHSFGYSFKSYSNITKISFQYRLNKEGAMKDGATSAWFGVKTGSSNQDMDSYQQSGYIWNTKTINTSNSGSYFTGLWQSYELNGLDTNGYIGIATCADFKLGSYLDIDDVTIVANGVTYTENFEAIATLFGASSKESYQQYLSFVVEELSSTDKAFDPEKGELFIYNYAAKNTLVTQNVTDPDKGSCVKITSWTGYDTMWLAFPQTAGHDELVRGLGGQEPNQFYFSVYNSGANDVSLQLRYGKDDWTNKPATTFRAGQWTDVILEIDANVTDISKISYYKWVGGDVDNQTVICDANTQLTFTAIRARRTANPAPFGVVALDAQTGYFRDTKGYNAPHTDSHGIDENYGAYIQIDDWKCPDNATQCWLTFSDTARDVADIEADLGKSITNYFFYIYNPLAENFTFKIMLKSSSGMNPNMNVACVAGEWTKVTVAYNQADNGSYPALTSASQLGLTQVLGNGAVVGSGWKVTSVYAE